MDIWPGVVCFLVDRFVPDSRHQLCPIRCERACAGVPRELKSMSVGLDDVYITVGPKHSRSYIGMTVTFRIIFRKRRTEKSLVIR